MRFATLFATAVLTAAAPMTSAVVNIIFRDGAACTGNVVGTSTGSAANQCLGVPGAAKSASYTGVPTQIQFFAHDTTCANGATLTLGGGNGCATAPDGSVWESVEWF